ncbi:MAG: hypothetical protein ACEQSM_02680 [Aliarcobacter sp.]
MLFFGGEVLRENARLVVRCSGVVVPPALGLGGFNSCEVAFEATEEIGFKGDVVSDVTSAGMIFVFDASWIFGDLKKNTKKATPKIKRSNPPNLFSSGCL